MVNHDRELFFLVTGFDQFATGVSHLLNFRGKVIRILADMFPTPQVHVTDRHDGRAHEARHGVRLVLQVLTVEAEGYNAVLWQHELDHLDGILYVDKVDDPKLLVFEEEFERYWAEQAEEDGDFVDEEG